MNRPLRDELERRREKRDRVRGLRELEPAAAEPEEHLRAVEVRAERPFGERAGALQLRDGRVEISEVHQRPGFAEEDAQRETGRRRRGHRHIAEGKDGLAVAMLLREPFRAGEHRLGHHVRPVARGRRLDEPGRDRGRVPESRRAVHALIETICGLPVDHQEW